MHIIHVKDDNSLNKYNNLVTKVPSMVLFYADWCGHCQNLKPEWEKFEKLAEKEKEDNFMVARVNEPYISKVNGHKSVPGYPTIYHLINGEHNKDYTKQRNVDGLIEFLSDIHPNKSQKGGRRKRKKSNNKTRTKSRAKSHSKKGKLQRKTKYNTKKYRRTIHKRLKRKRTKNRTKNGTKNRTRKIKRK